MITELKSVRDVWKKMPTERHARLFLENAIWGDDRFCPHCGSARRRGDFDGRDSISAKVRSKPKLTALVVEGFAVTAWMPRTLAVPGPGFS